MKRADFRARFGDILILSVFSAFLLYWFGPLATASSIFSVDLPGHVQLIDRTVRALRHGTLFFFDPWWFSGWPVFDYYGLLPYVIGGAAAELLSPLSRSPELAASHAIMLFGCAALPWSLYYAALPMVRELWPEEDPETSGAERLCAVYCCVLAFWFLVQPGEWHGIGAGAIWHTGFYPQLFGWHAGLLFLGALYRTVRRPGAAGVAWLGATTALLITAHVLTAFFFGAVAALALLRFSGARLRILGGGLLGLLIAAPQWSAMALMQAQYTWRSALPAEGDLLQLLFAYPLSGLAATVRSWMRGEFVPIDLTYLLVAGLLISFLGLQSVAKSRLVSGMGFLTAVLVLLCSSTYVASSVPAGVHYYRLYAYLFLLVTQLCTVIPAAVVRSSSAEGAGKGWPRIARSVLLWCALVSFGSAAMVSSLRGRTITRAEERRLFTEHMRVLAALKDSPRRGRVMFEYDRETRPASFISPQFLPARVGSFTGRETMNGLFIQSSLSAQFAADSLSNLGASAYRLPPLAEPPRSDDALAVRQLKSLGVDELVLVSKEAVRRTEAVTGRPAQTVGRFAIASLTDAALPLAEYPRREIVGYIDRRGTVPFKYVDYFFFHSGPLSERYEVIELSEGGAIPEEVRIIIAHGGWSAGSDGGREVFGFGVPDREALNPLEVTLSPSSEQEEYHRIFPALQQAVGERLLARPAVIAEPPSRPPAAGLTRDGQAIEFGGAVPGKLFRINYSFLPHWRSAEGEIFRGTAERIFFLPNSDRGVLRYDRNGDPLLFGALLASAGGFALCVLLLLMRRDRRPKAGGRP